VAELTGSSCGLHQRGWGQARYQPDRLRLLPSTPRDEDRALKQALDHYGFDAAFGGARRDEEKSRAKERVFSFRSAGHVWDRANHARNLAAVQTRVNKGETIRVFPLSNWTELDIWNTPRPKNIPIVPLYLAKPRPVVERDGMLIMRDDERMPLLPARGETRWVRFRSLAAIPSPPPSNPRRRHWTTSSPRCAPREPPSAKAG